MIDLLDDPIPGPGSTRRRSRNGVDRNGLPGGGPVPPKEIPEWAWPQHPLLAFGLREGWFTGDEIELIGLTAEQASAVAKLRIVRRTDGRRYCGMPPRLNADWFIDGMSTKSAEDLVQGLLPDIQRYYLCGLQTSQEYSETIIAVSDGRRRRFFSTSRGERSKEVDAAYFQSRRDSESRYVSSIGSA